MDAKGLISYLRCDMARYHKVVNLISPPFFMVFASLHVVGLRCFVGFLAYSHNIKPISALHYHHICWLCVAGVD